MRSFLTSAVIAVLVFAFVGVISSFVITVIWPGQLELVAPLFCSDAQPDAFVVSDTYRVRPGETAGTFTLYCMGPRGDATDVGYLRPFLAVSAINGVVVTVLLGLVFRRLGRPRSDASV